MSSPSQSYTYLFADDMVIPHIYDSESEENAALNEHLKRMEMWLDCWRLSMAVNKCQYIVFHSGKRRPVDLNMHMYGVRIERFKEVLLLEMTFDEKMNFKTHVAIVKRNASTGSTFCVYAQI